MQKQPLKYMYFKKQTTSSFRADSDLMRSHPWPWNSYVTQNNAMEIHGPCMGRISYPESVENKQNSPKTFARFYHSNFHWKKNQQYLDFPEICWITFGIIFWSHGLKIFWIICDFELFHVTMCHIAISDNSACNEIKYSFWNLYCGIFRSFSNCNTISYSFR